MSTPSAPEPSGPVAPVHPGGPPEDPERPEGLEPRTPPGQPEDRWRPWSALVGLLAALAIAILGGLVIALVATAFGADLKDLPPSVDILSTFWQDLGFIAAAVLFAGMVARPRPWQFGLRRPWRIGPTVGWAVLAYVTFVIAAAVWVSALGLQNEKDTLPKQLGATESEVALIAVAVLVCVVAPLAEEFFFRGFFFRALANWRGLWPAAIGTGLVFGGIHAAGSPAGFLVPLGFLGFLLCLLYARTGSLYPCIALHCVNNCLAYGSSVDWTWQTPVAMAGSAVLLTGILWLTRRIAGPPPGPMVPLRTALGA